MHVRIKFKSLALLASPFILVLAAAYIQFGLFGRPYIPPPPPFPATPEQATVPPYGFPIWLIVTHYVNFILLVYLVRSGLQILADHPRLYWNAHCTPGSNWIRFTPVKPPKTKDHLWTAKDDARYLSPWIGLPGYRHTVGMARHWHFISLLFWVANGAAFIILLFVTDQWQRMIPTSWSIVPQAWAWFVNYATFHLPPEPNAYYLFDPLQKLAYFAIVFVIAPFQIITGISMSPALTARFKYPKLLGNRQIGRSLHFLGMCAFVFFVIAHVCMVGITDLFANLNHITLNADNKAPTGLYITLGAVALVVLLNVGANWAAWRWPRWVQHASAWIVNPIMWLLLGRLKGVAQYSRKDISPYFWPNGRLPVAEEWLKLAENNFEDYRLKVGGLVENPVELSLQDLRFMTFQSQITMHHCIQGWSGIAEWAGLPLSELIKLVRPNDDAYRIVFHSFGDGYTPVQVPASQQRKNGGTSTGETHGRYYDTLTIKNAMHPQVILAYDMNGQPLGYIHGAPLRLRIPTQLGFKMVKWIDRIEFVSSKEKVGEGEGGYGEDHEYFGVRANI